MMAHLTPEDEASKAQWDIASLNQFSAPSTVYQRNSQQFSGASIWGEQSVRAIPQPRSLFTLTDASGINSNPTALKSGSSSSKDPKICSTCGYKHGHDASNGSSRRGCPPCPPGGGGDGKGDGDGKKDDKCDDDKAGGDNDPPPPPGTDGIDDGNLHVDVFYSEQVSTFILYCFVGLILPFFILSFACAGSPSLKDCLQRRKCNINDNLAGFFNKTGQGQGKRGKGSDLTALLIDEAYQKFKSSMKNSECRKSYGDGNECPGLINYASTFGGASIVSIGKTQVVKNRMLCRCQDKEKKDLLCTPGDKSCAKCICGDITAASILREENKLTPGICWAFSGVGEIQISLIFPIVVFGVSIHHPAESRLPPGFITSAPKEFELWGMNELNDSNPFHFGKFQYVIPGEPTQIFEVQNQSHEKYAQVKIRFNSNHGNANYTSLYKLEVHGLTDYAV